MKLFRNGLRSRSLVDDNNAIAIILGVLIIFVVFMIAGLLFLMWVFANLWNIALPLCIIIVVAILAKRFLLEKKAVAT